MSCTVKICRQRTTHLIVTEDNTSQRGDPDECTKARKLMTASIAAAYRGAAQRIKDIGWVQRTWTGDDGSECLVQALGRWTGVVAQGEDTTNQLPKAYLQPLVTELGVTPKKDTRRGLAAAVWGWNDEDGRTVEQVTALLQRVAKRLEAEAEAVYAPSAWNIHLDTAEKKATAPVG